VSAPTFEPLFEADVEVGAPVSLGHVALGERRMVPILGGTFSGAALSGEVLSGGADWQWASDDGGLVSIDAHYALRERSGAVVEVRSQGVRAAAPDVLARLARGEDVDPREYYFRTVLRLTTGDPTLAWLNRLIAVATAVRRARRVELDVYRLL
jgi:hypothetical protein